VEGRKEEIQTPRPDRQSDGAEESEREKATYTRARTEGEGP
jgi:hypothetical protein